MLMSTFIGLKAFVSFCPPQARYMPREEVLKRRPCRVLSAKETEHVDFDIWVQGLDSGGSYYGCIRLNDIQKWPHCVSLRCDLSIVDNLVRQQTNELKLFVEHCWGDAAYEPVFRKFHHQPVGKSKVSGPNHERLARALRKLKARNFRFSSRGKWAKALEGQIQ